jgi:hypothetical protein
MLLPVFANWKGCGMNTKERLMEVMNGKEAVGARGRDAGKHGGGMPGTRRQSKAEVVICSWEAEAF